ncbi:UNVERIFIED_ORG: phosphotransferase family enzyme, partial [Actinomadura viridilutea]
GNTLSHTDLRADNILITAGGVKVVDWAYAVASAPWTDLLLMLPSVAASSGIDPEPIWHAFPRSRDVPDDQANAVLAALAGDFLTQSLLPAPPNIPGLRQHQRAKGEAALRWLRTRLTTTHP